MTENLSLDVIIELTAAVSGSRITWYCQRSIFGGKGEFIYLVGRVGSGKSSLIKTINAQIPLKRVSDLLQDMTFQRSGKAGSISPP